MPLEWETMVQAGNRANHLPVLIGDGITALSSSRGISWHGREEVPRAFVAHLLCCVALQADSRSGRSADGRSGRQAGLLAART